MAAEFPPNGLDPTNPSGGTIRLGAGVQRIDGTDYPLFEGGDEEAGGGAYLNGGVIKAKLATGSVVNGSNEVTADLASPASVELNANKWRAKFKASHATALTRGTDGVEVVLDPATDDVLSFGASGVLVGLATDVYMAGGLVRALEPVLHFVDVSATPLSTHDPNAVAPTITLEGGGTYNRAVISTQAAARDGADEVHRRVYAIKDASGATVDITDGNSWAVIIEVERVSITPGGQGIVGAGLGTRLTTTGGQHAIGAICSGTSSLQRCLITSATTNSNSTDASVHIVRMVFVVIPAGVFRLPGGPVNTYTSAPALSLENAFNGSADASPGTVGLECVIGIDGTATGDTLDFVIRCGAIKLPALGG